MAKKTVGNPMSHLIALFGAIFGVMMWGSFFAGRLVERQKNRKNRAA